MKPLLGAAVLSAGQALAGDSVSIAKTLSDEDFYRAVSCGASPGGACREAVRRWPQVLVCDLEVSIRYIAPGYPVWLYNKVSTSLDNAIREVNDAAAAVSVRRVADGEPAQIRLYLPLTTVGGTVHGTGDTPPDGYQVPSAFFTLDEADGEISGSVIVLPRSIFEFEVASVVLEELTQSLGLPFDLEGKAYSHKSIFDADSNALTELAEQDKRAVRRHYPAAEPCLVARLSIPSSTGSHPT